MLYYLTLRDFTFNYMHCEEFVEIVQLVSKGELNTRQR